MVKYSLATCDATINSILTIFFSQCPSKEIKSKGRGGKLAVDAPKVKFSFDQFVLTADVKEPD